METSIRMHTEKQTGNREIVVVEALVVLLLLVGGGGV